MERRVKEQKAAEERLQKEAKRKQLEEEERLKNLEEERKTKEDEQLKVMKEEKLRREENERLKQNEAEQNAEETKLLGNDVKLKQELQNVRQEHESQNSQRKAEPETTPAKQSKVKFDEEKRLHEQLKILQEQARKQKENEQNQELSKNTSFTATNKVGSNESLKKKCEEKVTVTTVSENQLHEQKLFEVETKMQKQPVKTQGEQKMSETDKCENILARQNSRKTDRQQKRVEDMKRKEAEKTEELSKKKQKEKVKQEQKESEVTQLISTQNSKDTSLEMQNLAQSELPVAEKCNSLAQRLPEATAVHVKSDMKSRPATNCIGQNVKDKNSYSAVRDEADSNTSSKVAPQVQKPNTAAKCEVTNSSYKDSSDAWEKTVEARRLKWMHGCESWRYKSSHYFL